MGNRQSGKIEKTHQNSKKKIRITKILKRFEMCPAGQKAENMNNTDEVDNAQPPERKIYHVNVDEPPKITSHIKNKDSEWVDVPLDVPESPRHIQPIMSQADTPKVPPRKYLKKKKLLVESSLNPSNEYFNKIPVEEPIIIAKKESVHICDGKHHHVSNVCGKTNCDTNHKKQDAHPLENAPQIKKLKTLSVVSLPDYKELQQQPRKNDDKQVKKQTSSNKSRNISVSSFPVEGKISFSAATAERLESYITRCKSFGSLRPQQVIDKIKNQEMKDGSDSDDSWDGLDDWDLGVVEQEFNITSKMSPYKPKSVVQNQKTKDYQDSPKTPAISLQMPKSIVETDEQSNSKLVKGQHLPSLRRESIDDFFVNKCEPDSMNAQEVNEFIKNSRIGRRGSDLIHGFDTKSYPFRPHKTDHTFKSDSFFSSALIETESHINNPHFPFKNTSIISNDEVKPTVDANPLKAARRRSGSVNTDEVLNHLQNIGRDISDKIQEDEGDTKGLKKESTGEANDHSNLYKIINDNSVLETKTYNSPYNSSNVSFDSKLIISQMDNMPHEGSTPKSRSEPFVHKINQKEARYKFMTGEDMPKNDSTLLSNQNKQS